VTPPKRIVFVSTMTGHAWGGSEELWSRTALDFVARGFSVSASVAERSPLHPRLLKLRARGVDLRLHPIWHSWCKHPWRRLMSRRQGATAYTIDRLIAARPPALVVLSEGGPLPLIEVVELCAAKGVPFVTIGQMNWDGAWYPDDLAERYRIALAAALRCFFVSQANWRLVEKQIGAELPNAEVVRNPVNVSFDASPPWPPLARDGELRFACVGRLHPPSKGQDILFEALAMPSWRGRRWRLRLYGEGNMRQVLERHAAKLGIADRVVFAGFALVEQIWAANHVLVMPSRYEGLPLAMVEAMLCARPVIATDVAGHAEIVEDGVSGFLAAAPTVSGMAAALERFWERRAEAEEIGKSGALRIRQLIPQDPIRVFSDKLMRLAGLDGEN